MSTPKPAALPPDTLVGGYRLLRRIATGGFGLVYQARGPHGEQVAIKEYLPASLATRARGETAARVLAGKEPLYRLGLRHFFEEGRALAQIAHPSVVGVLDFLHDNDTVYMVMPLLEGTVLQDFIVTARGLGQPKVLRESTIRAVFDDLLRGLRVVHQHKMLHLDIKPANIFITDDDRPVLLDFGAARQALSRNAGPGRPLYTPGFAAPEMYRSDGRLGPATDLYAVGACIYACMQGYPPVDVPQRQDKDRLELALKRLQGTYSDHLLGIVRWCMALDPARRPRSVFELQAELNREVARRHSAPGWLDRLRLGLDDLSGWLRQGWRRLLPSQGQPR